MEEPKYTYYDGYEHVEVHDACSVWIDPDSPGVIFVSDSCHGIDWLTFTRKDAAALWPLLKRFAESGTLAAPAPTKE